MASRKFEKTSIHVPNTRPIPAYRVVCSVCGVSEKVTVQTHGATMAPEGIAQRFRNKGWLIGSRDGQDVCPACQRKKRVSEARKCEVEGSSIIELSIKAETPREMTRDDRRIIFAKINDVYLDETEGYAIGFTDAVVAKDLGVPVAWVKQIREENFGVESGNAEIDAAIKQADQAIASAKQCLFEIDKAIRCHEEEWRRSHDILIDGMKAKRAEIFGQIDRIENKLSQTLKALGK